MKSHSKQIGDREYTVKLFDNGMACTSDQKINPKTGRGWQASKNIVNYDSHAKAMWAWCKIKD